MVLGSVLLSWDTKLGAIIEVQHPDNFELSNSLLQKVFITHSFKEIYQEQELIQVDYDNQIILSFCDKSKVPEVGYEIVFLILEDREKTKIYKIKTQFIEFARKVFQKSKTKRNQYFSENIITFFEETSEKKILLLGRAATGKTSIKQIIFEGKNPKDLLINPLEPTRGISPSIQSWLDLKLGVFDSSGQELIDLLENAEDPEHILAFGDTDVIIYIFGYPTWASKSQKIMSDIQKLLDIIKDEEVGANLVVFIHKIDLIEKESRKSLLKEITMTLKNQFKTTIYYTSIYPGFIYNLYNAFYDILSIFSKETIFIKRVLDDHLTEFSKTMYFITNKNNSIIAQSMTKDFKTEIINHTHKLVAQLTETFEDMSLRSNIDHLILSSLNNFNLIMNNLNFRKHNLKNLICLSETLGSNKLIWAVGVIRQKLNNLYYLKKGKS